MLFQENFPGVLLSSTVEDNFAEDPSLDPITFSQQPIALPSKLNSSIFRSSNRINVRLAFFQDEL